MKYDTVIIMLFVFILLQQFAESPAQECSRHRVADVQLRGAGHVYFQTSNFETAFFSGEIG